MIKSTFLISFLAATAVQATTPPCVVSYNALGQKVTCCSQVDGSQCCSDAVDDKGLPVGCNC